MKSNLLLSCHSLSKNNEELMALEEMENQSTEIIAIYHSHPHTIPFPSEADVEMALSFNVLSIIISLKDKSNDI
jgi:proteasome lid subunit RPN8/RPN11